jgi:hypothetical protein
LQTTVEVGAEFLVRRAAGRLERTHDDLATRWKLGKPVATEVAQPALDTVSEDRGTDGPTDHEPDPDGRGGIGDEDVHHEGLAPAAATTPRDAA